MGRSECSRGTLEYSHGVPPSGTSTHARTHRWQVPRRGGEQDRPVPRDRVGCGRVIRLQLRRQARSLRRAAAAATPSARRSHRSATRANPTRQCKLRQLRPRRPSGGCIDRRARCDVGRLRSYRGVGSQRLVGFDFFSPRLFGIGGYYRPYLDRWPSAAQRATGSMQHPIGNVHRATGSMQHQPGNVQHATCNRHHATRTKCHSRQHATGKMQQAK